MKDVFKALLTALASTTSPVGLKAHRFLQDVTVTGTEALEGLKAMQTQYCRDQQTAATEVVGYLGSVPVLAKMSIATQIVKCGCSFNFGDSQLKVPLAPDQPALAPECTLRCHLVE